MNKFFKLAALGAVLMPIQVFAAAGYGYSDGGYAGSYASPGYEASRESTFARMHRAHQDRMHGRSHDRMHGRVHAEDFRASLMRRDSVRALDDYRREMGDYDRDSRGRVVMEDVEGSYYGERRAAARMDDVQAPGDASRQLRMELRDAVGEVRRLSDEVSALRAEMDSMRSYIESLHNPRRMHRD